jgi:hypothetical protein
MISTISFVKMFRTFSVVILAALTLGACGNAALAARLNDGNLTICHATGSAGTPYDEIKLDFNELVKHIDHKDDIIPAPPGGCPKTLQPGNNLGKLTICHATDSATKPYNEITIDFNGLRGHIKHNGDIIPAPAGGCPSVTLTPALTLTLTTTLTPSGSETPTVQPTSATSEANDAKITICHATGSKNNPYVLITVSINGLNGHGKHPGDIIPAPAGGCPTK